MRARSSGGRAKRWWVFGGGGGVSAGGGELGGSGDWEARMGYAASSIWGL